MSKLRIGVAVVAITVALSIATSNPSPPPPPSDDCQVTGRSDGSVSPEIMAENAKIAKQICEDLSKKGGYPAFDR